VPRSAHEHSFSVFPEIYLERSEHATDPIETCTITLARPISRRSKTNTSPVSIMRSCATSVRSAALYMRLFVHFANLYDGHHKARLSFPKRLRRHLPGMVGV